jgi:hypothetical protein
MQPLTDNHLHDLVERGFIILEDVIDEATCRKGVEEMEKVLKPWSEVKDDPPAELNKFTTWPSPSLWLNRFVITNDVLVDFAQRYLQTEHIQLRTGTPFVRYPGCVSFTEVTDGRNSIHIDNINNSLLPACDDHIFGQVQFWCHLQEVGPEQAPLLLWPHGDQERDYEKAVKLSVPAGSMGIFTNYTYHSASPFTATEGQRYIWGGQFGRADHYWEGFRHYTDKATDPHFQALVSSLTPRQREMLRFPPAGHRYYTEETLQKLEERYPGFDATGAYRKMIGSA